MIKHLNIKIYGEVQGVFFRVGAKEKADELGIFGFVKNESDGVVYIEIEGLEKLLNDFIDWCKVGPWGAKVEKVEVIGDKFKNFTEFKIVY